MIMGYVCFRKLVYVVSCPPRHKVQQLKGEVLHTSTFMATVRATPRLLLDLSSLEEEGGMWPVAGKGKGASQDAST